MALLVYDLANAVITGLLIIPLFVFWICGLCIARRRGDPARTGFRYLHAVLPLEVLALVFNVIAIAMAVSINIIIENRRYDTSLVSNMSEAVSRMSPIAILFEMVASALSIMMFFELGNGFAYAHKGARSGTHKILRFVALGATVVMSVLALAYFAIVNAAFSERSNGRFSSANYVLLLRNSRLLLGAWYILMWIISICLLVQAAITVHKSRAFPSTRSASVLYLVAVIFFFIRCFFNLIWVAMYTLARGGLGASSPSYFTVISAVFNDVLFFISLVLVVSMGLRRNGGLNSIGQPMEAYGAAPGQQLVYAQQPQQGHYPQQYQQQQPQAGWQYPQGQPQQYYVPSQYPTVNQPVAERKSEAPMNGA